MIPGEGFDSFAPYGVDTQRASNAQQTQSVDAESKGSSPAEGEIWIEHGGG